jgi:hypothetical protein
MRDATDRPSLDAVLRQVVAGRTAEISVERSRSVLPSDARHLDHAVNVLAHFVAARRVCDAVSPFPFTAEAFRRVAHRIGTPVGMKSSYRALRLLVCTGALKPVGTYRQGFRLNQVSGFQVQLYMLAHDARRGALRHSAASVGNDIRVNSKTGRWWWQHPLFGEPGGPERLGLTKRAARGMKPLDRCGLHNHAWERIPPTNGRATA